MKLSLLGCDSDTLDLIRALCQSGKHELVSYHLTHGHESAVAAISSRATTGDWETLLVDTSVDAVIVGRPAADQSVDEQLRKLVQAAVPLIVCHPLDDVLFAYELQMMRDEAGGVLLPYFPGRGHPAIARLAEIKEARESSPIGQATQLVIERDLATHDRDTVLAQLTCDAHLIGQVIGRITDVSAVGDATSFSDLSVVFRNEDGFAARWSLAPVDGEFTGRYTLVAPAGRAIVWVAPCAEDWALELADASQQFDGWDEGEALLTDLAAECSGTRTIPTWQDACFELEIGESIERSLRRKRTIELGREVRTEEGNFKGIMAAGGCLLLLLPLAILLVSGIVDGLTMPMVDRDSLDLEPAPRAPLWIRLWPAYPLVGFLLLQLLLFVAKKSSRPEATQQD